jgi:hypothetical protein
MRRWARAPRELHCGYCFNRTIAAGDPICYVKTANITRELKRCVDCAGPAPPNLPALPELKTPGDFSMTHVGAHRPKTRGELKATAREWMPYREPGCDDD